MSHALLRGPFGITWRRSLAVATLPTLLAAGVCWLSLPTPLATPDLEAQGAAAAPLVTIPIAVAALLTALAAVRSWPLFARERPGADVVQRLARGPWAGNGAAVAGAVLAQLVLTLPLALLLVPGLGAPATAHAVHDAVPPPTPLLTATGPALQWGCPTTAACDLVRVRVTALLPEGPLLPTTVRLQVDDEVVLATSPGLADTGQTVAATFAPRRVGTLTITPVAGTVPLWLPRGAVQWSEAAAHSTLANTLWAVLLSLLPTFAALALGAVAGRVATLPTVQLLVGAGLFVLTIGDAGPFGAVWRAVWRGQWLASHQVLAVCLPLLAVGSVAMMLAMRRRPGGRR